MQSIKIKVYNNNIIHVNMETQYDLTSTFFRIQEFYESPKFRGKYFEIMEYMDWYASTNNNEFTYFKDWAGFNIPSTVFEKFFVKFKDLTFKEIKLYSHIQKYIKTKKYYIIGTYGENNIDTIKHELSHAFFYLNKEYKNKTLKILNSASKKEKKEIEKEKKELLNKGYTKKVLDDEIIAYASTSLFYLYNTKIKKELCKEFNNIYEKTTKN